MQPRQSRWLLAVAALGCLVPASSRAEKVIPPGQEGLVVEALTPPAAMACQLEGASIQQTQIVASFRCAALSEAVQVVVTHVDAQPTEATEAATARRVGSFALRGQKGTPAPLLEAIARQLLSIEDRWHWVESSDAKRAAHTGQDGEFGSKEAHAAVHTWTFGMRLVPLLAPGFLLLGIGLLWRGGVVSPEAARGPFTLAAAVLMAAALGVALLGLLSMRLHLDDFQRITTATLDPWIPDLSMRLLSVRLPFALAVQSGALLLFFKIANGLAWAWLLLTTVPLLQRLGSTREGAWVGASLLAMTPGLVELMAWPTGLQVLLGLGVVQTVLLVFDHAARDHGSRLRRLGWVLLLLGLCGVGMLVKYPIMVILPPALWCWGRFVVREPAAPWKHWGSYLLFPLALGGIYLLFPPQLPNQTELGKLGLGGLLPNLMHSGLWLGQFGEKILFGLLLAWAIAFFWPRLARRFLGAPQAPRDEGARGDANALTQNSPRAPAALILLALAAIFLAPFLLNARYFERYYLTAPMIWLGGLAGYGWGRLTLKRFSGAVAALALAGLAIPWGALQQLRAPGPAREVAAWLEQMGGLTHGLEAPCALLLQDDCSEPAASTRTQAWLAGYWKESDGAGGVHWATGWQQTPVFLGALPMVLAERCPDPLYVRWCEPGSTPHITRGSRSADLQAGSGAGPGPK